MIFGLLRNRGATPTVAETIHGVVVEAARRPALYRAFGAPDTLPGRFELIVLHTALYLRRLRGSGPEAQARAQEVLDAVFSALDAGLREIGVGDTSVPKKMKTMARSFFDGAARYERALDLGDDAALAGELEHIVYRGAPTPGEGPARLAAYVREADAALAAQTIDDLVARGPVFPPIPETAR